MIFTSFEFIAFFAAVFLLRQFTTSLQMERWLLLVASYVFYMSWSIPCGALILFTSGVDYLIGARLGGTGNERRRKALLVPNLDVLAYFK